MKRSLYTFVAIGALTALPLAHAAEHGQQAQAQPGQQSETVQQYGTDAISQGKVQVEMQGEGTDYDQAKKKEPDYKRAAEGPRQGAWDNLKEDDQSAAGPEPDSDDQAQDQVAGSTGDERPSDANQAAGGGSAAGSGDTGADVQWGESAEKVVEKEPKPEQSIAAGESESGEDVEWADKPKTLTEDDLDDKSAGAGTTGGTGSEAEAEDNAAAQADAGQLSDETITARINQQLTEDEQLQAVLIDVQSQNGVVSLKGQVGSEQDRDRVIELVRNTDGVSDVQADIDVQGTATAEGGTESGDESRG